jgi:hypothetical protein
MRVFVSDDSPDWLGRESAEHAIRELAESLDTDFFSGRLRVASTVKLQWLRPHDLPWLRHHRQNAARNLPTMSGFR